MDKTGGETHKYDREKQKLSLENQKRFPNEKQAVNESCKFQSERKIYIKLYIHARSRRTEWKWYEATARLQHETFEEVKRRAPCVYVVYAVTYYIQAGPLDPVVLFIWICTRWSHANRALSQGSFFLLFFVRSFVHSFLFFSCPVRIFIHILFNNCLVVKNSWLFWFFPQRPTFSFLFRSKNCKGGNTVKFY